MSEPFEAELARKLEARLGAVLARWEAFAGDPTQHTFKDGYVRALYCISIATVGLWYPMLLHGVFCRGQYAGDPGVGVAAALTIFFATIFAFRATDSLCCAYQATVAQMKPTADGARLHEPQRSETAKRSGNFVRPHSSQAAAARGPAHRSDLDCPPSRLPFAKRLPSIAGTVLICWTPTLLYTAIMIGGLLERYAR